MRVLIVGIIVLALAVAGVSTYLIRSFGGEEKIAELHKEGGQRPPPPTPGPTCCAPDAMEKRLESGKASPGDHPVPKFERKRADAETEKKAKAAAPGAAAMPSVASRESPPVYNAIFDPLLRRTPVVLAPGRPTKLSFFIAPNLRENVLQGEAARVNEQILKAAAPLDLTVTMDCTVCEGDHMSSERIAFDPKSGRSSTAVFHLLPRKSKSTPDNPYGRGEIHFGVKGNGVEYDYKTLTVFVTENAAAVPVPGYWPVPAAHMKIHPSANDVTIYISKGGPQDGMVVELEAHSERAVKAIAGKNLDAQGRRRVFQTEYTDASRLRADYASVVFRLKAIVEQNDKALKRTFGAGGGGIELSKEALVRFTPSDLQTVLGVFAKSGKTLYRKLFGREQDLSEMIENLEKLGSRDSKEPLRVVFETSGMDAPWQLLHPTGPSVDIGAFWGMKFELAVRPYVERPDGPLASARTQPYVQGGLVMARYRGDIVPDKDEVAVLGRMFLDQTSSHLGKAGERLTSGEGLKQALAKNRDTLAMIVTYTHSTGGYQITELQGQPVVANNPLGARMLFALQPHEDHLTPRAIDELQNTLTPAEWRRLNSEGGAYFGWRPIVMLNACETGEAFVNDLTGESFQQTFLKMGAGGVIVTHAPVWALFAYHYGNSVINLMAQGRTVAQSVRDARWLFFTQQKNPMGLLYAYYGNHYTKLTSN